MGIRTRVCVRTVSIEHDQAYMSRILGLSLTNGGPAGGIWMFLVVCIGMFFVVLSMAEMASMSVLPI